MQGASRIGLERRHLLADWIIAGGFWWSSRGDRAGEVRCSGWYGRDRRAVVECSEEDQDGLPEQDDAGDEMRRYKRGISRGDARR